MKDSQKNRKMPKKKRVIIEIMKVFKTSLKISIGVNVLLLVLNSMTGGFIGFNFYIILSVLMSISLTPCLVLCDSKRIFDNKVQKVVKQKNTVKTTRSSDNNIKRKKIS